MEPGVHETDSTDTGFEFSLLASRYGADSADTGFKFSFQQFISNIAIFQIYIFSNQQIINLEHLSKTDNKRLTLNFDLKILYIGSR